MGFFTASRDAFRSPRRFLKSLFVERKALPAKPISSPHRAFDFYADKEGHIPRLTYRRLYNALVTTDLVDGRREHIDAFLREIETDHTKGDFQKFKWVLPEFLVTALSPEELARVDHALRKLRERRNRKLLTVYPVCADEFSLAPDFIDSVFDATSHPVIGQQTRIFTLGSSLGISPYF